MAEQTDPSWLIPSESSRVVALSVVAAARRASNGVGDVGTHYAEPTHREKTCDCARNASTKRYVCERGDAAERHDLRGKEREATKNEASL